MGYAFADRMNEAKVMLAGLKANQERLARRGITADFVIRFETLYNDISEIDNAHEALKARLKESTAELWSKMGLLNEIFQEAKTTIKLDMPQESWKEYGFSDKR